jgi:hypothetical protein
MTLTRIRGNYSFNFVPDKNNKNLPDDTKLYDGYGFDLGTIKELRDKHIGTDTTNLYRELYYKDIEGGGVSADAQRNTNAASVGKRIVADGNLT